MPHPRARHHGYYWSVMPPHVTARHDPSLHARVVGTVPLRYTAGADPALDRPAHVRAASAIAPAGSRLVVVQDDANFVALVDPLTGDVAAVTLPSGAGGRRQFDDIRGNKADKLDLEAVASATRPDGEAVVLAFGSGSTPRRESIVVLRQLDATRSGVGDAVVELRDASAFYRRLREAGAFAGSELNVEAAVFIHTADGGVVRLFNRGNGASSGTIPAVDATCDVSWPELLSYLADLASVPPAPRDIIQYTLGAIDGLRLTFTGATALPVEAGAAARRILYTAAAEASPDTTRDGAVTGCAVGAIVEGPRGVRARWAILEDAAGSPFRGKVEGIVLHPTDPMRAHVVVDRDAPAEPAELLEVVLEGPWPGTA